MGSQPSSPATTTTTTTHMEPKVDNRNASKQQPPILIPPSFGVGPADRLPLTLAAQDALHASFFPVLWRYIQVSDPSHRILNDHLQTGFWWTWGGGAGGDNNSVGNGTTNKSTVSASMVLGDSNNSNHNNKDTDASATAGRMLGERKLSDSWIAQVRGGTQGAPNLVLTHWSVVPGLCFKAAANAHGQAWASSILYYSHDLATTTTTSSTSSSLEPSPTTIPIDVRAVTWLPLDLRNKQTVQDVLSDVPHVNVFGAFQIANVTAAVEHQIPTSSSSSSSEHNNNNTGHYYGTIHFSDNDDTTAAAATSPPLQLTVQKTPHSASLSLSQVFTVDRLQFNPYEDRADRVRNTIGWTVQMEQQQQQQSSSSALQIAENDNKDNKDASQSAPTPQSTHIVVGGAWQVNRSVALKAVVRPQVHQIDAALILKRWKQPRVTCSFLARHNWRSNQSCVLGLGLELETGSSGDDHTEGGAFYADNQNTQPLSGGARNSVPETKLG